MADAIATLAYARFEDAPTMHRVGDGTESRPDVTGMSEALAEAVVALTENFDGAKCGFLIPNPDFKYGHGEGSAWKPCGARVGGWLWEGDEGDPAVAVAREVWSWTGVLVDQDGNALLLCEEHDIYIPAETTAGSAPR